MQHFNSEALFLVAKDAVIISLKSDRLIVRLDSAVPPSRRILATVKGKVLGRLLTQQPQEVQLGLAHFGVRDL